MQTITDPVAANPIYIARIAGAEGVAAFMKKVREGEMVSADAIRVISDFKFDFSNQYRIIEITDTVIARAMALIESHKLRGYDGVQLAVALEVNDLIYSTGMPAIGPSMLSLVSADDDLNIAASAEGLMVEDPRGHLDADDKVP